MLRQILLLAVFFLQYGASDLVFASSGKTSANFGDSQTTALFRGSMTINAQNHLEIEGVDVVKLTTKSNYPIYVLDEKLIRHNMQAYSKSIRQYYKEPGNIFYASKAFISLAMCKIAAAEGLGLDVSTEGELYTAIKANFPMQRVILHGNNKSEEEIKLALTAGVGRIVVDNLDDIALLNAISGQLNKVVQVLIRVKPGIEAHTHRHIATGNNESKFGFIIDNGAAESAIFKILKSPRLKFAGLHIHIGSQILDLQDYTQAIDLITNFMQRLHEIKVPIRELDLGGGLGVRYTSKDKKLTIEEFVKTLAHRLTANCTQLNLPLPKLMLEPGRSIVAEAGSTLYKVGSTKTTNSGQLYVAVNGGMSDNIRPALYQATYHAVLANRMQESPTTDCKIVGKSCESGDVLLKQIRLPHPHRGDTLVFFSTGAYHYSMASNYNRLPVPGVLLLKDGQAEWMVRPQTLQDVIRNDIVPKGLR